MRDDDRMPLLPGEVEEMRWVRFRSLGCYPLSRRDRIRAARSTTSSPRCAPPAPPSAQGRLIDSDEAASMEKKKREGYF